MLVMTNSVPLSLVIWHIVIVAFGFGCILVKNQSSWQMSTNDSEWPTLETEEIGVM